MIDLLQEKLAALLEQAAAAHHKYETEELDGVRDEQWPAWYADFLLNNGLDALMGSQADADDIAASLDEITEQQKTERNQHPWHIYSAAKMLERFI